MIPQQQEQHSGQEIIDRISSEDAIEATHPTHPTPTQHLEQQTERAVAIESNNTAWPSTNINSNNANDKNQTTAIIVDVNKTIYRLGHSDTFACHNCKNKGDKWFMLQHNCGNKSLKI